MLPFLKRRPHPNSNRHCPDCAVAMASYQCEQAVVERCLSCNGVWFDAREIGQFRIGLEKLDLESLNLDPPPNPSSNQTVLSGCPVCQIVLVDGQYTYNSKVSVKRCSQCDGIWLS